MPGADPHALALERAFCTDIYVTEENCGIAPLVTQELEFLSKPVKI